MDETVTNAGDMCPVCGKAHPYTYCDGRGRPDPDAPVGQTDECPVCGGNHGPYNFCVDNPDWTDEKMNETIPQTDDERHG